ncbi:MAG: DUF1311 domain-containing protein [Verrucomicrobiales bacterium]|nr:DUF1311 domain-containing protein [Verrucomicrobiales bacterium]
MIRVASFLMMLVASAGVAFSQSQSEMNHQAKYQFEFADKALNKIYQAALKKLHDEEAEKKFREAQRAWVKFRDAEAESVSDEMRGGSASPLLFFGTKARLTRERIRQIAQRFELGPVREEDNVGADSAQDAAEIFFKAYKAGVKDRAFAVAGVEIVEMLEFSQKKGQSPTLEYSATQEGGFISYEGGGLNLFGEKGRDGKWRITSVEFVVD